MAVRKQAKRSGGGTRRDRGAAKVRIRMYRQGLGDCFLVSFFTGDDAVHMLIDCGTLGTDDKKVKMVDVVADIARETGNHLDLLIATHEHRDHVSGFNSEREAFDEMTVDRVWLAWTEDAKDSLARDISKYRRDLVSTVAAALDVLEHSPVAAGDEESMQRTTSGTRELLGFVGEVPDGPVFGAGLAKTVQEAMSYVTTRAGPNVSFLKPGEVMEPEWLPGVRFYVLGPPRSKESIARMGEHGSPDLYALTSQYVGDLARCARFGAGSNALNGFLDELAPQEREEFVRGLPFDPRFRIEDHETAPWRDRFPEYFSDENCWRRVDQDWLAATGEFALQLDSYTNNTSLALAIEIVGDGRVLLFPADAQLGHWVSWHDYTWRVEEGEGRRQRNVTAADLLANTVFYKVGHHASHNATASRRGLELMQHDDLVAFIPVDRKVAMRKTPPWVMPAEALYERLLEKTRGRVYRSDIGSPEDDQRPDSVARSAWDEARQGAPVAIEDLFIDYELR